MPSRAHGVRRVWKFRFIAPLAASFLVISASAQIQFDRPKTAKPLPNPSIMSGTRDDVVSIIKQMLETREIPLANEDCNATTGECTLISKPVIFTKGIPAK